MARDCRQPRQEDKSKRPCFICGKIGHLAWDCRDKPNPLKMLENGEGRQPVFLGCVEAVDADGFRRVGRPQPQGAHVLDFISRAAAPVVAKKHDSNRFRALTVADLITNAAHTELFQGEEEKSNEDINDLEKVLCCGMCESQFVDEHVVGTVDMQDSQSRRQRACVDTTEVSADSCKHRVCCFEKMQF